MVFIVLAHRYGLGNQSEMLVVVRQDSATAPIRVDFITDRADKLVLHWGVSKPGGCQRSNASRSGIGVRKLKQATLEHFDSGEGVSVSCCLAMAFMASTGHQFPSETARH